MCRSFLSLLHPDQEMMSDTRSLIHKAPKVSLRMEEIQPRWPRYRAVLDLEPQERRAPLSRWIDWLPGQIEEAKEEIRREDLEGTEDSSELDPNRLCNLWTLHSLMHLPHDVIIAARKRLFGALPPSDSNGEFLFSWVELHLIAAAFWPRATAYMEYLDLVRTAEAKAKRQKEVNQVFADLRKELG